MSQQQNICIAQQLLAQIGKGGAPDKIADLFSGDVEFEIAGDVDAPPWIGRRTGRRAVSDFIRETRRLIERLRFDVQDILASADRAVIVGELTTRVKATGKIIESPFGIILTVSNGEISRFQMLEDSFAVSRASIF